MSKQRFVINQPAPLEETLHCEFKEVKGPNAVKAITNTADEYAVAYLNSDGGSIFWGIRDSDRTVIGVRPSYGERDKLRKVVTDKLVNIQPSISPTAYQIPFYKVYDSDPSDEPISDLFVIEVVVPRVLTNDLYFTGGNEAFVKTDAGKKKLSGPELQDEILRRLQDKVKKKRIDTNLAEENFGFSPVLRRARMVSPVLQGAQVLWVDDNPGNNIYERMTLKSIGITVDLAVSTAEALLMLSMSEYDAVISDMERYGKVNAGLQLLYEMRKRSMSTQVVFYTWQVDIERGTPAGAFAITEHPDDFFHYILDILERERV